MSDTAITQGQATPAAEQNGGQTVTPTVPNGGNPETTLEQNVGNQPFKVFTNQEEFDKHSAGIMGSAKAKAEKELLSLLGLKPDEKDKLTKFKELYESNLTDAEKQKLELETLSKDVVTLQVLVAEKDAIIAAMGKITGKNADDVSKYVKMAKGLVSETVTIDMALNDVFAMAKVNEKPTAPVGQPLPNTAGTVAEVNPFQTGNMTAQANLIKTDRDKARVMYQAVTGKCPSW